MSALRNPIFTVRDGIRLAHFEYGRSDPTLAPIVLVHGWISDHRVFTPQIDWFSQSRRIIAVNLRGHGASDAPRQDYTIAGFAEDIAWQCRENGVEKPIVIGASLGGVVALELCGRFPDFAAGLAMIDSMVMLPSAVREDAMVRNFLSAIEGPDYLAMLRKNTFDLICDFDIPRRKQSIFETYLSEPCDNTPQHVACSAMRHFLLEYDPSPAASACKVPMAYISADTAAVAMARDLDRLQQLCPQLVTAKTLLSGHLNTIEVYDQVNAMLERFIDVGLTNKMKVLRRY